MRWLRIAARVAAASPEIPLDQIHVESLGSVGGFTIWTVDGEFVRNNVDIDFVAGGNPARYPSYVPDGEIWLEETNDIHDMAATALHEAIETNLMQKKGLDYETAHDFTDKYESTFRAELETGDVKIQDNTAAIALVNSKIEAMLPGILEEAPEPKADEGNSGDDEGGV